MAAVWAVSFKSYKRAVLQEMLRFFRSDEFAPRFACTNNADFCQLLRTRTQAVYPDQGPAALISPYCYGSGFSDFPIGLIRTQRDPQGRIGLKSAEPASQNVVMRSATTAISAILLV